MVSLRWIAISMAAVIIVLTGPASAREDDPPNFGRDYPILPLWGDTHLHTQLSMDAGAMGTLRTVDDAYRFARGEEVVSTSGVPAKLSRPLDFLVVADHSDAIGTVEKSSRATPISEQTQPSPAGRP